MPDIKLNFINRSNDRNNSRVVIFQRNEAAMYEELTVAWKVIENCGQGWSHSFAYPMNMYVASSDSWGNISNKLLATNGQQFSVVKDGSGDRLLSSGIATDPGAVEVLNTLEMGSVSANIYKDGRLLATKSVVAPGQKAVFDFKPTLWIGVASQIEEGDFINSAVMSSINTELSLGSIRSADIVMTGGGPGPNSTPFKFTLVNVQTS